MGNVQFPYRLGSTEFNQMLRRDPITLVVDEAVVLCLSGLTQVSGSLAVFLDGTDHRLHILSNEGELTPVNQPVFVSDLTRLASRHLAVNVRAVYDRDPSRTLGDYAREAVESMLRAGISSFAGGMYAGVTDALLQRQIEERLQPLFSDGTLADIFTQLIVELAAAMPYN